MRTQAADDPLSTVDAAASARAVAAAINAATPSTGVQATVGNTSRALTVLNFGDLAGNALTVNGVPVTGTITDAASLVAAVNAAQIPGVFASSSAANNLTLTAADGRNIALATDGSAASGINFLDFNPSGGVAASETTTGVVTLSSANTFTLAGLNPGNAGLHCWTGQSDGAFSRGQSRHHASDWGDANADHQCGSLTVPGR